MATQDEDFQKRLNEALGMFGQAPADMPVQTVDPVRAERLAFEASQGAPSVAPVVPQQPALGSREALIAQQAQVRQNAIAQQEALQKSTAAITKRPRQRFLNEGQGFMDAFKNPGAGQRQFAINAGLSLLSSGGTQDLSQRIGHALGTGVQGMQAARQGEIDVASQAAKAQQAALGLQATNLNTELGFTKDLMALDRQERSDQTAIATAQTENQRYKDEQATKKAQVDYSRGRDNVLDNRYITDTSYNRGRDITGDRLAADALTRELARYKDEQDPTSFGNLSEIGQLNVQINDPKLDPGTKAVLQKELNDLQNKPPEINKIITDRNEAKNFRVQASNLPDDDPNKAFLLENADLLEANANRLAYGSAGVTTTIDPTNGKMTITQGGPANKGGLVGKSDFYESQTVANLTTVNAQAAVDAIRNVDYGASSGRFAPIAEMFSIGLSDAERAAQTSANKINSQLMLLMTPYLKPMSNVDLEEAKEGMKIPNNLEPEYQMQWLVTQFPKLAMANLEVAAINTGNAPQRKMDFGSGMAMSLIKPSYNYKEGRAEFMVNTPTPDQRGRVVNNSVKDVLENFFPRASEAETFKGQGYTLLKGYNRVIPANVKQQMIKNLMAQSKTEATFQDAEAVFNEIYSAEEFK